MTAYNKLNDTHTSNSGATIVGTSSEHGRWYVSARAGRNLLSCDINGKSDPWLLVTTINSDGVKGDASKAKKSPVVAATLNPDFHNWTCTVDSGIHESLLIQLWDRDIAKKDDFMGQLVFKVTPPVGTTAATSAIHAPTGHEVPYISSNVITLAANVSRADWYRVDYRDEKEKHKLKDKSLGDVDLTISWQSDAHRRVLQAARVTKLIHDAKESDSKSHTHTAQVYEAWFADGKGVGVELRGRIKIAALDDQPEEWKSDDQDFSVDINDVDEKTGGVAGRYHLHGDKISSSYQTLVARSADGGKAAAQITWRGTRSMQINEGVIELIEENVVEEFEGLVDVQTRKIFGTLSRTYTDHVNTKRHVARGTFELTWAASAATTSTPSAAAVAATPATPKAAPVTPKAAV